MTEAEFISAVTSRIRARLPAGHGSRFLLESLNADFRVRRACDVGPQRYQEYLNALEARLMAAPRDPGTKIENPDKKREGDSALNTSFSIYHLNLAYWMGRSLGDGSLTLESWQAAVLSACGAHVPLGDMTPEQCKATMLASGMFTPSNLPVSTEHMTQRMN